MNLPNSRFVLHQIQKQTRACVSYSEPERDGALLLISKKATLCYFYPITPTPVEQRAICFHCSPLFSVLLVADIQISVSRMWLYPHHVTYVCTVTSSRMTLYRLSPNPPSTAWKVISGCQTFFGKRMLFFSPDKSTFLWATWGTEAAREPISFLRRVHATCLVFFVFLIPQSSHEWDCPHLHLWFHSTLSACGFCCYFYF